MHQSFFIATSILLLINLGILILCEESKFGSPDFITCLFWIILIYHTARHYDYIFHVCGTESSCVYHGQNHVVLQGTGKEAPGIFFKLMSIDLPSILVVLDKRGPVVADN